MFNEKQVEVLNQELAINRIKSRQKGNINLSYLEGFDILDTANNIFGFGNWSYNVENLESVSAEMNQNSNHIICYKCIISITVQDIDHLKQLTRMDVGFGSGIAKTLADAHEGAAKEAVTDAIKRAMRSFGNQFGNSLYSKDKKHSNNQQYNQPAQQNNYQSQQLQNQQNQSPYQHQQDFSTLQNVGLSVMQQGENLVVVGDGIFDKKSIIRNAGFFWNAENKIWYMPQSKAA